MIKTLDKYPTGVYNKEKRIGRNYERLLLQSQNEGADAGGEERAYRADQSNCGADERRKEHDRKRQILRRYFNSACGDRQVGKEFGGGAAGTASAQLSRRGYSKRKERIGRRNYRTV